MPLPVLEASTAGSADRADGPCSVQDGKGTDGKGDGRKRGRTEKGMDGKGTDGKGRWVHLRETKLVPAPEAVKTEAVGFLLGWFSLSRNQ